MLPLAGLGLALWAAAWLTLGWIGETVMSVVTGAGERVFASRGRDPQLVEFAESVAARIARRG